MSYFDRVRKANPYHDGRGRFSTHESANSVSIGPAHAKTIERLKAQLEAKEKASQKDGHSDYGNITQDKYAKHLDDFYKKSEEEFNKLSSDEKFIIRKYSGNAYKYYNAEVAKPIPKEKRDPTDRETYKEMELLDTALEKTTVPESTALYKAMNVGRLLGNSINRDTPLSELKKLVGIEFVDVSYGSASTSIDTAINFGSINRLIVKIKTPKGAKGAWLGSSELQKVNRSKFHEEGELLFPRDRAYKVLRVVELPINFKGNNNHLVELELLNPTYNPTRTK